MATCACFSPKGGVAKTTTAVLLASELALVHGYRVALLDADANQHAAADFGAKADIPGLTIVPAINETNIMPALRHAEDSADVVFLDLPGMNSTLNLKALQRSNFILLPCQPSLLDVQDALKGMSQVEDAEELARAPIAKAMMWSRVPSGFESRVARHVRETVEARSLPLFATQLFERAPYKEMFLTGRPPRQSDPDGIAAQNVAAITAELLDRLARLAEEAA